MYFVGFFSVPDTDICEASTTHHYRKGNIYWPATDVGLRRIVRCPYAYDQPWYAYRDCILSLDGQKRKWSAGNVTRCIYSPFSSGVDSLTSYVVSTTHLLLCLHRFSLIKGK